MTQKAISKQERWAEFLDRNCKADLCQVSGQTLESLRGVIERMSAEDYGQLPKLLVFSPISGALTNIIPADETKNCTILYLGPELIETDPESIERTLAVDFAGLVLGFKPESRNAAHPRYSESDYKQIRAKLRVWGLDAEEAEAAQREATA